MLGLGSLIGSGWLFGSWEATKVAGPAAIISWFVGAVIIGVIAYNYIELGTMLPESGGMSKYAQYTHGSLLGFIASWANWISLITLIPIEAVAAVQYMDRGHGVGQVLPILLLRMHNHYYRAARSFSVYHYLYFV